MPLNRLALAWVTASVLFAPELLSRAPGGSLQAETPAVTGPIFKLVIPDLDLTVPGDSSVALPHAEFGRFSIHIAKSSRRVNYGDIHAKINTESANIVMTIRSTGSGLICDFDLTRRAGFQLRPGRNSVEIELRDRSRKRLYASFLLRTGGRASSGDSVTGAHVEPLRGKTWAVIVGVSEYRHPEEGIANLQFADDDARSFRAFLRSPAGGSVPDMNIRFLVNDGATSQAVRSALFTFLTRAEPEDLVILYFAGHGAPDPNDRRNLYLLTHDTRVADFGGTAFPMWQLQDVLGRVIRARRVVVFTDACHSEGIGGAAYGSGRGDINLVNQYLARYTREAQHALLTGSDISEFSFEDERWGGGHGAFTYFLLQGLKGEADANGDGTVTAGELFPFVRRAVSAGTDGRQNPQALPGLSEGLPLASSEP